MQVYTDHIYMQSLDPCITSEDLYQQWSIVTTLVQERNH